MRKAINNRNISKYCDCGRENVKDSVFCEKCLAVITKRNTELLRSKRIRDVLIEARKIAKRTGGHKDV